MHSHPKKGTKNKKTFNEFRSFLFLYAYLVRQSNIIVTCYANRMDYFSSVFPFSNAYISNCTKISMNNWKFRFFFTLSNRIQPILITYEFCRIYSTIVPVSFNFLRTKLYASFSPFFLLLKTLFFPLFLQSVGGMLGQSSSDIICI